jgi:uncharacterized protein (TIGR00730 family)
VPSRVQDPSRRATPRPRRPPPLRRHRPLPLSRPKPAQEDASAPARLRAILRSASYRPADEDVAFLNYPETRGVRLQLDYLKAESILQAHGVHHTIVVFGSTRIPEPAAARRALAEARTAAARRPDDAALRRAVQVARRLVANSRYYEVARQLGMLVARSGARTLGAPAVIMTGGGPGIMEGAQRGAFEAGAPSVGLNITLPHEQFPNPYVTPDLCLSFHYFAIRKLHFLLRARALIAFPGGYGTFDELFETLMLVQTRKIAPLPVVLVGEAFWRRAFPVEHLVREGVVDPEDAALFWYAETAEEIWAGIEDWYAAPRTPAPAPARRAAARAVGARDGRRRAPRRPA